VKFQSTALTIQSQNSFRHFFKQQEWFHRAFCQRKNSQKGFLFHTKFSWFGIVPCFRKKCQIVTNLIMLVAALLMAFSKTAKSFEMILAGRFLYGVGTGMCPQHCAE